jgi:amidase/aspartyl-tRNA(Asn)/glutamyl-tRNA(Gln) amidotransferase subunit A
MDTIAPKTPATLPFAAWQAVGPAAAAREVHGRVEALPPALRSAALAWLRPEWELAGELAENVGASLLATQDPEVASKLAPTAGTDAARPLQGIPYLLKDLFDLAGVPTNAGSTFLDKMRGTPRRDTAIVEWLRARGAVCAGKSQLVEFASGLTGENPHYGDCPHPRFPDRLSGGSSSGSAALVAAGVVPLAIGTDTGGSVRVPAAWCGLFGFRLTPGDKLIADAFPLSPTMDTAGWFTANATDMLTMWKAIITDRANPSAVAMAMADRPDEPHPSIATARRDDSPHPFRGSYLPLRALLPNPEAETALACDAAAARLCPPADDATAAGLLSSWREAVEAYVTIGMSEAHAVHRDWLAPYREHYDPVIWQRFTDAGHFPADRIARARATLADVRATFAGYFARHDFLVLPAVPGPAPRKADCTPELRRDILTLTAPASLGGLPVLSLPVALPSGLTAGLQVILPAASSPVVPWVLKN